MKTAPRVKKMKKLISIILIICTVFLLFACTPNLDGGAVPSFMPKVIKFDTNGGTAVKSQVVTSLNSAPKTSRENHLFYGWYCDEQLTVPVVYPFVPAGNTTLYARWLKLQSSAQCNGTSIKLDDRHSAGVSYTLAPSGYDWETLALLGYKLRVEVHFEVKYKKDYDVWLDIGYMGAPKFTASIVNSSNFGTVMDDVTAKTTWTGMMLGYNTTAASMLNDTLYLRFETLNMQNIIYIDEITVGFIFHK